MTRAVGAPKGYIKLEAAQKILEERLMAEPTASDEVHVVEQAAQKLRKALFDGKVPLFVWHFGSEPIKLDGRALARVPQPSQRKALDLHFLRPQLAIRIGIPEQLIGRLQSAELLLAERAFLSWLRKGYAIRSPGRPRNEEARTAARALQQQGTWRAEDGPGALRHELEKLKGMVIGRGLAGSIAIELGYRPRSRSKRT